MTPARPPRALDGDGATIDRRTLLAGAGGLAAWAATLGPLWLTGCLRAGRLRPTDAAAGPMGGGRSLTATEWVAMVAVQETLWPAGDGVPGAGAVNATGFLDAALVDPGVPPTDLGLVKDGLAQLEVHLRTAGGRPPAAKAFAALDPCGRALVLESFQATEAGSPWVRRVLRYTLEALLCDPVHGGNPDGIGWAWLDYEPGEPRPPGAPPLPGEEAGR